jgi:glycosylphosphatidylinositol transamidase (GPIT) subunit GPI8
MISCQMSTWVIIVIASRYWHNYRHEANGFAIYHIAKSMGIDDDHILLLDAADVLHNPRNNRRGQVYIESSSHDSEGHIVDFHTIEVDYRGEEVRVELLSEIFTPPSSSSFLKPSLRSGENSHVLLYLTGHGGDGFFKFQDIQELEALFFAQLIASLEGRFAKLLILLDTCQAATMGSYITTPGVFFLGSSKQGENSYALHVHEKLGVAVVDRFTYALHTILRSQKQTTLKGLLKSTMMHPSFLFSRPELIQIPRLDSQIPRSSPKLLDFFSPLNQQQSSLQDQHIFLQRWLQQQSIEMTAPSDALIELSTLLDMEVTDDALLDTRVVFPASHPSIVAMPSDNVLLLLSLLPWLLLLLARCRRAFTAATATELGAVATAI